MDDHDREGVGQPTLVWLAVMSFAFACSWWIVALPPFSYRATLAVLATGAGAAFTGARHRRRPRPRDERVSVAPWVVLVGFAGAWQLAAYLQHPRADHPTISSLVNPLLDTHAVRAAGFVLWLVGAVALARR